MLGKDLIVYADGVAIAAAKSCNVERSVSTIETSSPMDGASRTYIVGRSSWKVTVNVLVTEAASFLLEPGTVYTLSFGSRTDSSDRLTGEAICTHAKITATKFNLCQGSFEFLGSGPLEQDTQ